MILCPEPKQDPWYSGTRDRVDSGDFNRYIRQILCLIIWFGSRNFNRYKRLVVTSGDRRMHVPSQCTPLGLSAWAALMDKSIKKCLKRWLCVSFTLVLLCGSQLGVERAGQNAGSGRVDKKCRLWAWLRADGKNQQLLSWAHRPLKLLRLLKTNQLWTCRLRWQFRVRAGGLEL